MNILIIEDEEDLLEIYAMRFADHNVTACKNGAEGIKQINSGEFDLVLTDLKLPDKNGDEIVKAVKNGGSKGKTPVMVVSGFMSDDVKADLEVFDDVYFFDKPVPFQDIKKIIKDLDKEK